MKVLKFGGSSVATAENINKVAEIVKNSYGAGTTVIVVSALGGITDALLQSATLSATGDDGYKDGLQQIERSHINVVKQLLPVTGCRRMDQERRQIFAGRRWLLRLLRT